MGYSIAWIATRGLAQDAVLDRQALRLTAAQIDYPDAPIAGKPLDSGWYLVVADRCDHRIVSPAHLASLSAGCEVVACAIEEHVMVCSAEAWTDGTQAWRVEHDAQVGVDHLSVTGTPPEALAAIKERCTLAQQGAAGESLPVDCYFEIPLELANAIVGYRHDDAAADENSARFTVLVDAARRPWWQFWK